MFFCYLKGLNKLTQVSHLLCRNQTAANFKRIRRNFPPLIVSL